MSAVAFTSATVDASGTLAQEDASAFGGVFVRNPSALLEVEEVLATLRGVTDAGMVALIDVEPVKPKVLLRCGCLAATLLDDIVLIEKASRFERTYVGLSEAPGGGAPWHFAGHSVRWLGRPTALLCVADRRRDISPAHADLVAQCARHIGHILAAEEAPQRRAAREHDLGVMSLIAHELNTPLNAVVGFSSILKCDSCTNVGARMHLNALQDGTRRLQNAVQRVQHAIRLMSGGLPLKSEAVDVQRLFLGSVNAALAEAQDGENGASLPVRVIVRPVSAPVKLDRSALEVILNEAITNAIRHRKPGSRLHFMMKEKKSGLVITVKNKIAREDLRDYSLFQGLFRVGGGVYDRLAQGLGLGLLMISQVAAAAEIKTAISIKGRVWVFRVMLPPAEAQP